MSLSEILLALVGIGFGGFLKGATGAGAPIVGVPILAMIFGVPMAVAIFSVLNLVSNLWHAWAYRAHRKPGAFVPSFALSGAVGVVAGSFLLASLPTETLMGTLGAIVLGYIALRLARPDWVLSRETGERLAALSGLSGGLMQGAGGISAPISVTYLNAMRLSRDEFIGTISVFFIAMSATQVPTLVALDIITRESLLLCLAAAVPLFSAIPLGEWAARHFSRMVFDRIILGILGVIALRLIWTALT